MVCEKIAADGYEDLKKKADELQKQGNVYVLFCGSKDGEGKSWCPDCVRAEPVVEKCLKFFPENSKYIYCTVGGRDFWKDKNNIFRTSNLKLAGVPTFLRWDKPNKKLVEKDLFEEDLLIMMLEDDDQ